MIDVLSGAHETLKEAKKIAVALHKRLEKFDTDELGLSDIIEQLEAINESLESKAITKIVKQLEVVIKQLETLGDLPPEAEMIADEIDNAVLDLENIEE